MPAAPKLSGSQDLIGRRSWRNLPRRAQYQRASAVGLEVIAGLLPLSIRRRETLWRPALGSGSASSRMSSTLRRGNGRANRAAAYPTARRRCPSRSAHPLRRTRRVRRPIVALVRMAVRVPAPKTQLAQRVALTSHRRGCAAPARSAGRARSSAPSSRLGRRRRPERGRRLPAEHSAGAQGRTESCRTGSAVPRTAPASPSAGPADFTRSPRRRGQRASPSRSKSSGRVQRILSERVAEHQNVAVSPSVRSRSIEVFEELFGDDPHDGATTGLRDGALGPVASRAGCAWPFFGRAVAASARAGCRWPAVSPQAEAVRRHAFEVVGFVEDHHLGAAGR